VAPTLRSIHSRRHHDEYGAYSGGFESIDITEQPTAAHQFNEFINRYPDVVEIVLNDIAPRYDGNGLLRSKGR